MKKLIAVLLSALLLCALMSFATVSAAEGDPTIVLSIVDDLKTVNAGEEFQLHVDLLGLEDTAGLISVLVEIGLDPEVFELVTSYDEDEETWIPAVEIGAKYNASSNKYISYGYINEDTGKMEKCLVKYMRATATTSQVRKESDFCTLTLKVKDNAESGTYELNTVQMDGLFYGNTKFEFNTVSTSITVNGSEPACEHEYEYDCSKVCSLCGEESRPEAEHQYLYTCDPVCMLCWEETNPSAKHNVLHVDAKPAISCIEFGNKEYWYCDQCGTAWLDENLRRQTNLKSVMIAGECVSNAEYPCQDGVCINCGLDYSADAEHTYDNAYDASCNICGEIRDVVAAPITFKGNATSVEKSGLAFLFEMAASDVQLKDFNYYVNGSATVVLEDVEYTLVTMGAIMNNMGETKLTLDMVDDKHTMNVEAERLYDWTNDALSFAVRAINIPEEHYDTEIIARPYMILEKDGAQIVIYGDVQSNSYNGAKA